jgi:hypothetical protein
VFGTEVLLTKGVSVTVGSLAKVSRTAESALGLYGGARAVAAATTVGVVSRGARLGARSLVGSVDEFGQAAFAGLRRGLSRLSGASQYAVIRQVRSVPDGVRSRVATAGVSDRLVGYVARTGSEGSERLETLDVEAEQTLLNEPRNVQRAIVQSDADADVVATALRRSNGLNKRSAQNADELIAATRGDGIEFFATADDATIRAIADGSGDLDESYDRAVVRARGDERIDNDVIDGAVETVEELNGGSDTATTTAKRLVRDAPRDGSRFLDVLGANRWRQLTAEVETGTVSERDLVEFASSFEKRDALRALDQGIFGRYDVSTLALFIDATDGRAGRLADRLLPDDFGRLTDAIELDASAQRRVVNIVFSGALNGDSSLASDDISANEFLKHINDEDINPNDIRMVAKGNGRVISVVPGDADAGFQHLLDRHYRGTEINQNADQTTFFPSGRQASARGNSPSADLPSGASREDILRLIRETVEEGQVNGGDFVFTFDSGPKKGISAMRIGIEGGQVKTAFPLRGPDVKRWNRNTGQWEEWDGSNWVRWSDPYQPEESPKIISPPMK